MVAHRIRILFMFGLCSFLPPFIGRSIDLSLPSIGSEFGMTVISLSWVITIYLLATTVLLVPFGRLADIVGRRKVFLIGAVLFPITTSLCCCAYSGKFLIFARMLQGISCAMILGTVTAMLVAIFPWRERGRALGINASCVYLGSSLGPGLGGIMTQYWGWRSIFVMTTIFGMVVAFMGFKFLTDDLIDAPGESFDFIGTILYGVSVVSMLYGTTMLPSKIGYLVIATGIIVFVIFCIVEDYIQHPVFDIDLLLKNKAFAMSNLAALFNYSASFSVQFLMSLYLQYVKGMSPQFAGFIVLATPITMVIGSPIAGRLSDVIDPRIVATLGMLCSALAFFVMSVIFTINTPFYVIMLLLFMFGFGLCLFVSPNTSAAMGSVAKRYLSIASSVLSTTRTFGQSVSMGISVLVLSLVVGKVEISSDVLPSLMNSIRLTFFIFGLLCIVGAFASMARGCRIDESSDSH